MNAVDPMTELQRHCRIIPLERAEGRILAVHYCTEGKQYFVRYFDDGKANEVYFYPDELEIT